MKVSVLKNMFIFVLLVCPAVRYLMQSGMGETMAVSGFTNRFAVMNVFSSFASR